MNRNHGKLLGLPQGRALHGNLVLSCAFAVYFSTIYGTGNFVAAQAAERYHVALPFELMIPFVPWAAVIYLTVTPLFCLAPFVFRTPKSLLPLFATLCVEVTVAGVVFCLFPVERSFPAQEVTGEAAFFYRLASSVALTYNCVPSLHVALALTSAWVYSSVGGWRWRCFIWSWVGAIVVSTLLTHQHHLADLAAGALLSAVAVRSVPPRVQAWLDRGSAGPSAQALRPAGNAGAALDAPGPTR